MIRILLTALLLAAPAGAATTRVEVDAAAGAVPRVAPLSAPVSLAAPSLTAAPGLTAAAAPAPAVMAAPLAAPMAAPAPLAAAPALLSPAPALSPAAPASLPAASIGDEKPATPSGRIGSLLRSIGIPWGSKSDAAPAPVSDAVRLDRDFAALNLWGEVAPAARDEILNLRAQKKTKREVKEYVRAEAAAAFERIRAARGTSNIGFHFNLHGGHRDGYVGEGIRASKGDIALRYSMAGDTNDKVYFFQTAVNEPYTALDASNGEIMFLPSRMGSTLSLFAVDAPELKAAMADGRITNVGSISMDFHKGMRGVPYSAFLAPPLDVFNGTSRKVGVKRLTRDEETLATVRYIEAALKAGGAYIPKN